MTATAAQLPLSNEILHTQLSTDQVEQLRAIARLSCTSLSAECRRAVALYIADQTRQRQPVGYTAKVGGNG